MKKTKIYDGKTKKLYESEKENELILEFKDVICTFEPEKKERVRGKGIIINQISSFLFKFLESYHIPTHFIKQLSDREMLVKRLEMIPIELMIRNIAAGSLVERFGVEEGKELECPIMEYYLKDDERHDPMINEDHIIAFGHATTDELKEMHRLASKINAILKDFFKRRHLKLVDFRLEFGRYNGIIYVGDEISPDTCSFLDLQSGQKWDREYFYSDLSTLKKVYEEIRKRVFLEN